jgi:hypothetical protein
VPLDPTTGLWTRAAAPAVLTTSLGEGSDIIKNGFYYLFVSRDVLRCAQQHLRDRLRTRENHQWTLCRQDRRLDQHGGRESSRGRQRRQPGAGRTIISSRKTASTTWSIKRTNRPRVNPS